MSEANQIYSLVPKVAASISAVGKNAYNSFHKFNYRSIDDVYSALHSALCEHGVSIAPKVASADYDGGYCRLVVEYTLYAPDGSSITTSIASEAMDKADKATSKALSMAFKYWAFQTFCIPVEGSHDGDAGEAKPGGGAEPAPRQATAPKRQDAKALTKKPQKELAAQLGDKWVPVAEHFYRAKGKIREGDKLQALSDKMAQEAVTRFDDFIKALEKHAADNGITP